MFDPSISLGVIVQSILMLGGGLIVYGALRQTVRDMEKEIVEIREDQREMSKTINKIAVQDQRLNRIEEDLRELRHGQGWALPPPTLKGS